MCKTFLTTVLLGFASNINIDLHQSIFVWLQHFQIYNYSYNRNLFKNSNHIRTTFFFVYLFFVCLPTISSAMNFGYKRDRIYAVFELDKRNVGVRVPQQFFQKLYRTLVKLYEWNSYNNTFFWISVIIFNYLYFF